MTFARWFSFFALFSAFSALAGAATLEGVQMPDGQIVDGKSLKLNGMGARLATIFHVKVYIAGLYVETPSKSAAEILASPQVKRLDLRFKRSVDARKIRDAWSEGLEKICGECSELKPDLAQLNGFMPDVEEGRTLSFTFHPGDLDVFLGDKKLGAVGGPAGAKFQRAVLEIFLGAHPPNEALREGLLGHAS